MITIKKRYLLESKIGEGGSASVHRALDLESRHLVAVKMLRPQAALSEEERACFVAEAHLLVRLRHPHIVRVLDGGLDEGQPFLVMELLDQRSLRERLADGPLPVDEALKVAQGVASALAAVHAQEMLHLDVKPENILFDEQGTVRLADFGVCLPCGSSPVREDGQILGTVPYLAPEHLCGQPLDARADLYALGVVLYEMLVGARPFQQSEPAARMAECQRPPMAPHEANPAVPAALSALVLRALHPDAARRYPSAEALVEALHAHQVESQRATAAAPRPHLAPRPAMPPLRHPRRGSLAGALPAPVMRSLAVVALLSALFTALLGTLAPPQGHVAPAPANPQGLVLR